VVSTGDTSDGQVDVVLTGNVQYLQFARTR